MQDLTIWITYHDDNQIEEYSLKENEIFKLFKGNDTTVKGENINYLNKFYSELSTLYWVYKNKVKSRYIGFCHYRRMFIKTAELESNECLVLARYSFSYSLFQHYKIAHNYNDLYDIIEILEIKYGKGNKYSRYFFDSSTLIPFCSFIMHYDKFIELCDFLFPLLFEFDKKNKLNMNPDKYWQKAKKDFRYDNCDYQCRAISFLAERLISCYIMNNMKPFYIQEVFCNYPRI